MVTREPVGRAATERLYGTCTPLPTLSPSPCTRHLPSDHCHFFLPKKWSCTSSRRPWAKDCVGLVVRGWWCGL